MGEGAMTGVEFRRARPEDWPALARLLSAAGLPPDGAADHLERFVLGWREGTLVASAGVERHGEAGLLRSVAAAERGQGLGVEVVRRALDAAYDEGVRTFVLLTTTAAEFFPRFGFRIVPRAEVPASVTSSIEFRSACPASATAMRLDVTGPPVLVRGAAAGDVPAITRIFNEGIEDRSTLETARRTEAECAAWLAERGPRHPVLVAVQRGAVRGWAALSAFSPHEACRCVADLGIQVARESRGLGIGSRLLEAALDRARRLDYHKVVATTFPSQAPALALCGKFGFRHVGDYREQARLDGRWVDTRVLERLV
jgi:amino-acid N-acetyltransferase